MRRALVTSLLLASLAGLGCAEAAPPEPPTPPAQVSTPEPTPTPTTTGPAPGSVDPTTGFIVDDGWELVVSQCTACHSSKLVTQNAGDEAYWRGLITWMQKTQNLWPIPEPNLGTIVGYLAKNYPSTKQGRRPNLAAHLMPPTPSKKTTKN
jgi:ABC-type transport system substrate-binding protein